MTTPTTPPEAPKPGIKTTEFWLTLIANVLGIALLTGIVVPGSEVAKWAGLLTMVLATYGYQYTRAQVKAKVEEGKTAVKVAAIASGQLSNAQILSTSIEKLPTETQP